MIVPLSCAVEDDVFNAVSLICGEDVAWNLCYEDQGTFEQVREFVTVVYDGFKSVHRKKGETA
ncbi:hypothetical protein D3C85_1930080 [compost metagenome]